MEALVGGAALGALAGLLLEAVLCVKEKVSYFKDMFTRLESTLNSIIPRLHEIDPLYHKLDIQQHKMEELNLLVTNGTSLVSKCSQISCLNYIKKLQYWKQLSDLEDSLKNYFITLLPLEHFRNDLETLVLVREMHMMLKVSNQMEHSVYQNKADSAYQKKAGKKLFLLKGCAYDLDAADLKSSDDVEVLSKGKYLTSYRCNTKYGDVLMKRLNFEVKVSQSEFVQRMEEIGKVGHHPNIILPFGYFSSDFDMFLLYNYAPAGSLSAFLKEPRIPGSGTRSNWDKKFKIVLGIANGISHIHSQGGVIHGNIKSSNVLLTKDHDGCISDFSLARIMNLPDTATATSQRPQRKDVEPNAPELIETKEATQKSDVYNFGVILSETTSINKMHLLWHPNVTTEKKKMLLIGRKCRHEDPNRRPTMDEVVRMINKIQPSHSKRNDVIVNSPQDMSATATNQVALNAPLQQIQDNPAQQS